MHTKLDPVTIDDSREAIKPWMWNSGIILNPLSVFLSFSTSAIFNAEDMILIQESCTCLGLEVFPEVCSIKQVSAPLF